MKRYLVLENGSVYAGEGFGSLKPVVGELVFNTGMSGYQESITDLSYHGQILTFTYPLIGNYGINRDDFEPRRIGDCHARNSPSSIELAFTNVNCGMGRSNGFARFDGR